MVHGCVLEVSRRKMASVMSCLVGTRRRDAGRQPNETETHG